MELNQKESRQTYHRKNKSDQYRKDYDSVEQSVQNYKRREKYQSWKHQTEDDEDDYDGWEG